MIFFDYLFYSIAKYYEKHNEKGSPLSASSIVGGLQTSNLLTIYFLYLLTREEKPFVNVLIVLPILLTFLVYNYIKYVYREKPSINALDQKWKNKTESARNLLRAFLYLYTIISVAAFFGLAIYLGQRNK